MTFEDRVIEGKSRFLRVVLEGGSLEKLIQVGEQMLSNPILLGSANHFVWYTSPDLPKSNVIPQRVGKVSCECYHTMFARFAQELRTEPYFVYRDKYDFGFCPLRYKGRLRGYSCLVGKKAMREGDQELHQAFCNILVQEMEKHGFMEQALQFSKEEVLLLHLLEDPDYRLDARRLGRVLPAKNGYMEVVAVQYRNRQDFYPPSLAMLEELRKILNCEICFGYEHMLVALTRRGVAKQAAPALGEMLKAYDLAAGISYPFTQVSGLRQYYEQATAAINYGVQISEARISEFASCIFYNVVKKRLEQEPAVNLCHFDIQQLVQYDQKNHTALLETLKTYLECGCNIRRAAAALDIHRNSALARMERIRAITTDEGIFSYDGYLSILTTEADMAGR